MSWNLEEDLRVKDPQALSPGLKTANQQIVDESGKLSPLQLSCHQVTSDPGKSAVPVESYGWSQSKMRCGRPKKNHKTC